MKGVAAVASQAGAAEAARAVLDAGHGAVDAAIAGFFAAAGADADVLFASTAALVVGAGVGARAFDGRTVQPGRGAPRPRGFVDEAGIPEAAFAAAPRSIGMLALLHAYRGRASFAELARHGVNAAKAKNAPRRAALLGRIGSQGVLALRADVTSQPLIAAVGPAAGGTLSAEDLEGSVAADTAATSTELGEGAIAHGLPWMPAADRESGARVVLAADARGLVVALMYAPTSGGAFVEELEARLSSGAVPVRRGVTRTAAGTPLPAPAPLGVVTRATTAIALAIPGRSALQPSELTGFAGSSLLRTVIEALAAERSTPLLAILRDDRAATEMVISPG